MNLLHFRGSALVLDFKGTNCVVTAKRRKALGQAVYAVNPFGVHAGAKGMPSASRFNPLADLDARSKTFLEDLELIADALVIPGGGDSHWDDSARSFIKGVIAHVVTIYPGEANLGFVRDLLAGEAEELIDEMMLNTKAGVIAKNAAGQMRLAADKERGSILSNAAKHTAWLDSAVMREALSASDFSLKDLKRRRMTIYLILPPEQLGNHARFLRLFVNLTLAGVSAGGKSKVPVLLVLDEFFGLGRMDKLMDAAAILAGLNVRLWVLVQNLGQLVKLYGQNWTTFWANAGQIVLFAANDLATAEHASKELGRLVVYDTDRRNGGEAAVSNAPLRDPNELGKEVGRIGGRAIVFQEGRNALLLERVEYDRDCSRSMWNDDPDMKG